jgi:hypothetical protein
MRSKQDLLNYNAPFYLRIDSSLGEKRCGSNQKKIREFHILRCKLGKKNFSQKVQVQTLNKPRSPRSETYCVRLPPFQPPPLSLYRLPFTYSAQPGRRTAQPGGVGRGVARIHVDGMTCSKCVNYIQAMPYNSQ